MDDRRFPDDEPRFHWEPGTGPQRASLAVYLRLAWLNEGIWYGLRLRTALDAEALLLLDGLVSEGAVRSAMDGNQTDLRSSEEAESIARSWRDSSDVSVGLRGPDDRLVDIHRSAARIPPHLKVLDDTLEAIDSQDDAESYRAKRILQVTGGLALHDFVAALRLDSDSEPATSIDRDEFRALAVGSVDALEHAVSSSRLDLLPLFAQDYFRQSIDKARDSAYLEAANEVLAQTAQFEIPLRKANRSIFRRVREWICPLHPFC